jgi:hypothetical protein
MTAAKLRQTAAPHANAKSEIHMAIPSFCFWPCLILCRARVNADRAIPFLELSPISWYYFTDLRKRIAEIRKYTTWNRASLVAPLCRGAHCPSVLTWSK